MDKEKCPKCNCSEFKEGIIGPNTKLISTSSILSIGNASDIVAKVCTNCGHILEFKVVDPTIFK